MWIQLWLFEMILLRTRLLKPKRSKQLSIFDTDLTLDKWEYTYWCQS